MKTRLCLLLFVCVLWSCSKPNNEPLEAESTAVVTEPVPAQKPRSVTAIHVLKLGMTADTVKALLGEPSRIDTVSKRPETLEWWYGENQKVHLLRGQVTRVIEDVAKEQALLRQIVKAREQGNETEVTRLMDELTSGRK
jgi:hypothetical protein